MEDDLLENARRQADRADSSIRAAALLRIARAEATGDVAQARRTLFDGLDAVMKLSSPVREHLLEEARRVAAAVSPELLSEIPGTPPAGRERFASGQVVQTMVRHGHVDAAFHYVLAHDDPVSFPFRSVAGVLHGLDRRDPDSAGRRLILLRHTAGLWRRNPGRHPYEHDGFIRLFGQCWNEFSAEEASELARMFVDRALAAPEIGISSRFGNEIHFSSYRQNTLFLILHVRRHLDPALAQALVDSHDQLAEAARRYPNGLETMLKESEAEAKRRKADGATGGGGYGLAGDPRDFDRQRRLIDAARSGDFARSIEDALEKYREDTSSASRNYAPKAFWPSTGVLRTVFHEAGKRLGTEAVNLLEEIPDEDLHLFASIELAAALAGVPGATITSMKQPNPAQTFR